MKSILDPTFRYTASFDTDVRRTFERVRRERLGEVQKECSSFAGSLPPGPRPRTFTIKRGLA